MHRRPLAVGREIDARPSTRRGGLFARAGPADPAQRPIGEVPAPWCEGAAYRLARRIVAIDEHAGVRRRERGRAVGRVGDLVGKANGFAGQLQSVFASNACAYSVPSRWYSK